MSDVYGSVLPSTIRNLKVTVTSYIGTEYVITENVSELSIFESIYSPFLYGRMIIADNSAMLSIFPFYGQEKLSIEFERDDEKQFVRNFYINNVFDISRVDNNVGGYGLSFTSEKQMVNAGCLFSRSYIDKGEEIIRMIYDDFFWGIQDRPLSIETRTKGSYSINFPYIKPLAAISMITNAVLAMDNSPMFLYETLYGDFTRLRSYREMYSKKPIPGLIVREQTVATKARRGENETFRSSVYNFKSNSAYHTLNLLSSGHLGGTVTAVDISRKRGAMRAFSFIDDAPSAGRVGGQEWVTDKFKIPLPSGQRQAHAIPSTINTLNMQNAHGHMGGSISTSPDLDRMIHGSLMERMSTIALSIYMDSVTSIEAGKTIEVEVPRFSPKLEGEDDNKDYVNSGKYLISSVRHYIKNGEYSISLECIRDSHGSDATLNALSYSGKAQVPQMVDTRD